MRLSHERPTVIRSGMTLIELMIALVITGMALAAGYAALATVIDRRMQANTVVTDVLRATTVRRTLVDWLQQGQLQLAVGGAAVPQGFSEFGLGVMNDELRFVTTASTPLQRDSTVVQLYVGSSDDYYGFDSPATQHGLVALLTPTTSAQASMEAAAGDGMTGSAFSSGSLGGTKSFGTMSGDGYYEDDSKVVSLDSTVTTMHVDYLVNEPDSTHVWIPSSTMSVGGAGQGGSILAVRLTFESTPSTALQPMLALPIIVPVWTKL